MSFAAEITPLVLAFNEEVNIERTLGKLTWATRVLVVDSFSTDRTLEICARFPNVEVVQRRFDSFSAQINHGLALVKTGWAMVLGADYVLTDELISEISRLTPAASVNACVARFNYCIHGRPLRGSLYPPRELIVRRASGRYAEDGHGERWVLQGAATKLRGRVLHDDRKPLSRWLSSQDRYAKLEADKLTRTPASALGLNDRVRKTIVLGPPVVLLYTLFARGVILDGWAGWYYAFQRALAETLLSLRLLEVKLSGPEPKTQASDSNPVPG